ncbi:MAG TPA: electron transfer flavoprotein subunit alpha/FixB family protein, partial [Ferruginibacter sp.]|nr:electron transfer flavoprotein subunit alpha/FixB family protein [Ferruginibacter sp.]
MSVLIFLDQSEGHIKKSSFEAASYGAKVAELTNTTAEAIVLGTVSDDLASLGRYGIKKVHTVKNDALNQVDAQVFTKILAEAANTLGATVIVFSNNFNGKAIAPRLSVRL